MEYLTRTALRTSLRLPSRSTPCSSRLFSTSRPSFADSPAAASSTEASPEPTEPAAAESSADAAAPPADETVLDADTGRGGKGYRAWLSGEGARFRRGIPGKTNWLGEQPFPLNPTFSPLPPLADATKTKIYNAYLFNITNAGATDSQVVRAVSAKFGVGMERVRAIIRLKELEKRWKDEGIALQTNLLHGMESHLGVKQPGDKWRGAEDAEATKHKLATGNTTFEMVDVEAGDSSVFLPLLAKRSAGSATASSPSTTTNPRSPRTTKPKIKVVPASRPGRAATVFRDLSGTEQGAKLEKTYDSKKTKRGKPAVGWSGRSE